MALQNINLIQYNEDMNLSEETQKYLIEALANLGQRYSMKGDSIEVDTATLYKLIDGFKDYNSNEYICKVDFDGDDKSQVVFQLVDKDLKPISNKTMKTLKVSKSISKIRTRMAQTAQNISANIPNSDIEESNGNPNYDLESFSDVNSYDSYYDSYDSYDDYEPQVPEMDINIDETSINKVENVFMYANETNFMFSLKEVVEGGNDRFICEKYDKYTNKLESALRIFKNDVTIDTENYDHTLLYMVLSGDVYKLFVYHMDFSSIEELSQDGINVISLHSQKKYDKEGKELESVENEDISFSPETFITDLYTRCTMVLSLKTKFAKEQKSYNVTYDGTNYILSLNENETNTEVANKFDYYQKIVQYFAYDQDYMYRQLKKTFSELVFQDSTDNSSYNIIILEAIKDLFVTTYVGQPFYIPLDYEFEYAYNSNDHRIYFSTTDIVLRDVLLMRNGLAYTVFAYQDKTGIVRVLDKSTDVEKTTFYRFNVEYDDENQNVIYGISITKHFTLPYINQFGYWVIDDIATEVYARGRDAGNPNIIIVETVKGKDSPTILTMSNKEYFDSLNWVTKKAKIELPKRIIRDDNTMSTALAIPNAENISEQYLVQDIVGNMQSIYCDYLVPTLNNTSKKRLEENIEKLKYCIVMNIAHVDSVFGYNEDEKFANSINAIYGEDGRIMTFWVLDEIDSEPCGYGFKTIDTEYDTAVDINYMSNFVNTIGWVLSNYNPTDPDNFTFTQLVFDRADAQLKNNIDNLQRVYPVIKNESMRTSNINNENTELNNFNLKIQYNDTIEASYYPNADENEYLENGRSYINGISSLTQSETRYYEDWNSLESRDKASNSIYTYNQNTSYKFTEYIPGTLNKSVPTLDLSEIFVRDFNAINRTNIISFDSAAYTYYSYIGSDYTMDDKSILKIGTGTRDINLGNVTLVNSKDEELFNKQRQINIEFDNTRISTYAYVGNDLITEHDQITYGTTWRRYDIGGTTYWTTSFRQSGKYFNDTFKASITKVSDEDALGRENSYLFDPIKDTIGSTLPNYLNNSYAFVAMTVPERYDNEKLPFEMYIADLVWIPGLMHTICPQLDENRLQIVVNSSNDVIYSTTSGVSSYIGVRLNSSMADKMYNYNTDDFGNTTTKLNCGDNIFTSSDLNITYYVANGKYYFTIDDTNNSTFMTYLHKIRQNY